MFINSLHGVNTCNYKKLDINFNKGVTLINGANMSGKSSILDIITMGVIGECQKSKKLSYFRKRGESGPTQDDVDFDFMGQNWKISRVIGKKAQEATLHIDGGLKAKGAEDVKGYLKENFVPADLLLNSNLCGQRDIAKLLHTRDGDRFKIFKKIFDLDHLQRKAARVKKDIAAQEKELATISTKMELLDNKTAAAKATLEEVKVEDLDQAEKEAQELLDISEKQLSEINVKLGSVQQQIETIFAQNKLIEKENQERTDVLKSIEQLKTDIDTESRGIEGTNSQLKSLDTKIKASNDLKSQYEEQFNAIKVQRLIPFDAKPLSDARVDLGCHQSNLVHIIKRKELAEKGVCPECEQETNHFKMDGIILSMDQIKADLEATEKNIEILQKEQVEFDKKKEDNDKLKNQRSDLSTKIGHQKELIESYISQKTIGLESVQGAQVRLDQLSITLTQSQEHLTDLVEKPLIGDTHLVAETTTLQTQKDEVSATVQTQKVGLDESKLAVKSYHALKEAVAEDIKSHAELRSQHGKKTIHIDNLVTCKDIFEKRLPLFMVVHKLKIISREANKFLHKIEDQFTLSFEASTRDSLSILITDNYTEEVSPSENLSGWEETFIGLAIRVGISHYNNYMNKMPINLFAVDEPDKSADESNAALMFKCLKTLGEEFAQIIIITHKESIKESFYGVTMIDVKRNPDTSYIEEAA